MSAKQIQQIKRLYYQTTKATVERDLERAVGILKTLPDDNARARAAVYLDGLSQMRSEWRASTRRQRSSTSAKGRDRTRSCLPASRSGEAAIVVAIDAGRHGFPTLTERAPGPAVD